MPLEDPMTREFLPVYRPDVSGRELEYVQRCIETGWVSSLGEFVDRFEAEFAEYCGADHAVAVTNGTIALQLAVLVLGLEAGDEVIIPSLTFVATANAVVHAGGVPIIVDVTPDTWTIDPDAIEAAITPRTRGIIPVHLYGHPADMDRIEAIAERHGLWVVEDAAEAHGATYRGRRTGSLAGTGVFSFYGNKTITTGEGGMLTFSDEVMAARARFLKDHAMAPDRRYYHPEVGYNFRMTNLQAALGVAQLERIDDILAQKRRIASLYSAGLADLPGIGTNPEAEWAESSFWMCSILVDSGPGRDRDSLSKGLLERGVDSRPFFVPMNELPMYSQAPPTPVSQNLAARGLNLPSYPGLSDDQVERVCEEVRSLILRAPGQRVVASG
jgi:perosamine synthetase